MIDKARDRKVLYISPLPPPAGGIASWTDGILKNGLPDNFRAAVVNNGRQVNPVLPGLLQEAVRSAVIFCRLVFRLLTGSVDIVHLNTPLQDRGIYRDYLCAVIVKAIFNKPLVCHYHCDVNYWLETRPGFKRAVAEKLFRMADRNIVLNKDSYDYIVRSANIEAVILGNYINDDKVGCLQRPASSASRTLQGLFVGNVSFSKGCDLLLAVAGAYPQVGFRLVGRVADDFKGMVKDAPDNVDFVGEVSREAIFDYYKNVDFFVFPTLTEGFPVAVLEAMAFGLPVLASRVGAIPAMIDDGFGGFLFEAESQEQLRLALDKLLGRADLADMGRHNVSRVRDDYTYTKIVAKLAGIYGEVLDKS